MGGWFNFPWNITKPATTFSEWEYSKFSNHFLRSVTTTFSESVTDKWWGRTRARDPHQWGTYVRLISRVVTVVELHSINSTIIQNLKVFKISINLPRPNFFFLIGPLSISSPFLFEEVFSVWHLLWRFIPDDESWNNFSEALSIHFFSDIAIPFFKCHKVLIRLYDIV